MRIGALEGGGTKMVLAVCNENGEVLDRVSIPTETPEITMPKMHISRSSKLKHLESDSLVRLS